MGLIQLQTWMIWAHLIFRPITFWCHTGAYYPFRLGFVDSHLICVIIPGYEIHVRSMIWFHFVLTLWGASLKSFSQVHTLWYSHDSRTGLSHVPGFSRRHFSGVQVRSFVRPHGVILELSGQIRYIWCHTGAYFPTLAMEMIILSQICYSFHYSIEIYCICFTGHYSCAFRRDELSVEHDVRVLIAPLARTIR